MNEALPNRQSIRKKAWDYSASADYFVTTNTHAGRALFGAIVNGRVVLSEAGKVAEACWREIPTHFPRVALDEFVIMPNHVHGIFRFHRADAGARAVSLGDVVGAYKSAVSRVIGRGRQLPARTQLPARAQKPISAGASAIWHRNYWDVIVREEKALVNIRNYIRFNPQNYDAVMNVGEPQFAGDRELLDLPKVGFLASRDADVPQGRLPVKPGSAIISGFLSPMERSVFNVCLEHNRAVVWVKPWGLDVGDRSPSMRRALDEGRLLIVSPFSECVDAPSVRRAAWCNQYVLEHCDRMVIGHLNPCGMLACILSESDPEMEIVYL